MCCRVFTSDKEGMFYTAFVYLSVKGITQKLLTNYDEIFGSLRCVILAVIRNRLRQGQRARTGGRRFALSEFLHLLLIHPFTD